ncbi:pyridoxamine 5'-phosphate oxidase family protein [Sphingomonas colocasiae]|uniref:Pyridoxamine 5'-phosphate oxidase family protein n=1 Tax=Sphingomonas colocasiae TaxID=1848973 RepID=A0ABS7PWR6_9SPHN|nr:pyridoxamine 5'-phosphate oxidase family protein [Sphingomonas colocasiae]MBY8825804.1 pyridoxamine 5'-phosphate oxidase family protein [Sphingomonas colocasiae]
MSSDSDIRKRFWKEFEASPYLMVGLEDGHRHSVPMTAQLDKHADSAFWFYTATDNRLAPGGPAMAQFAAKGHDLFACIRGTLVAETDPAVIDRYWSKQVEAWYPGGREDPSLLMLRFDLDDAEIWLADLSVKGLFKLLTGGDIREEERGKHAELTL